MNHNLLNNSAHRPWPIPHRPWCMTQTWDDLLFLHWPLDPQQLRPLLPDSIDLDIFGGCAWLGVIPFNLSHIRLRGLPTLPFLSHFPEINIRTYVRRDDKPGIWFFNLDANHVILSTVARWWFRLPYRHSQVSMKHHDGWLEYSCRKSQIGKVPIEFRARYRPIGPVSPAAIGTLTHWLIERYCLYTTNRAVDLYRAEITHMPWPLQPAEVQIERNTLALASGVHLPSVAPLAHYSRSITSLIWSPELIAAAPACTARLVTAQI